MWPQRSGAARDAVTVSGRVFAFGAYRRLVRAVGNGVVMAAGAVAVVSLPVVAATLEAADNFIL